jgi:hypothetical protein
MNRRLSESASVLDDAHLNTSQIATSTREMFNLEAESDEKFPPVPEAKGNFQEMIGLQFLRA